MKSIKGVIVAAGYGTRFLPATKTIPKEMFPLIDRPAIDFILEEFEQAGIRDVLIISSRRKKALDDFLDREVELESVLTKAGKDTFLQTIKPRNLNVQFVRQQVMNGTGNALLLAEPFIGEHPFVVAYPDDLFPGGTLAGELIAKHQNSGHSVLAVRDFSGQDVSRFGVVATTAENQVTNFVEKPAKGQEPSSLVSVGRYLFEGQFFHWLHEGLKKHQGGEYYHLYAMRRAIEEGRLAAHCTSLNHLDVGDPKGYLEAICRIALTRPELNAKQLFQDLSVD